MEILEKVIPIGKKNAIHQKELAALLGVSPATAKIMIRKARERDVEIASGIQGYWRPKDDNERREYVKWSTKQALARLRTVKPIKRSLQEVNGQLSLSGIIGKEVSTHERR